jgi:hypothetical protein
LPDEYIKAREADLKRMSEVREGEETTEVRRKMDELLRQKSRERGHSSSVLGLVDITSLFDLFN